MIEYLIRSLSSELFATSKGEKLSEVLAEYIEKMYNKLRHTKNTLFRNKPINFYYNYIPITLKSDNHTIHTRKPFGFIEKYKNIIILGAAGCGKTTFQRYISLQCIDESFAIPIYIELRNFNDEEDFEQFVSNSISKTHNPKELFRSGKFVFIFDGFDEINFIEGRDIIYQIENFISNYNDNYFIISSRHGTNIESLSQFFVFEVLPLTKKDIKRYINRLEITNRDNSFIMEYLENDKLYYQYLTNPLFLSLYVNYLNVYSSNEIPDKKSVFFRTILDTLFTQHDSVSKLGFVRNKLSGLDKDELEKISSILAYRALVSSSKSFSKDKLYNEFELIKKSTNLIFENENIIYDLTITVNILVADLGHYSFSHIVFLEYLASLFISRLESLTKTELYRQFIRSKKVILSSTFLNFMYELDYKSFTRDFIMPFLKSYLENNSYRDSSFVIEVITFINNKFSDAYEHYYNEQISRSHLMNIYNELQQEIEMDDSSNLGDLLSF
jgi:predicted NACHT family NTPase